MEIISNERKSSPFTFHVPRNVQTRCSRFPCNFTNIRIRHQVIESRLQGRLEIKCIPGRVLWPGFTGNNSRQILTTIRGYKSDFLPRNPRAFRIDSRLINYAEASLGRSLSHGHKLPIISGKELNRVSSKRR